MELNSDQVQLLVQLLFIMFGSFMTILGYLIRRLFSKGDKNEKAIGMLSSAMTQHKLDDVSKFATKEELSVTLQSFKETVREMISPINAKLASIEEHLRKRD